MVGLKEVQRGIEEINVLGEKSQDFVWLTKEEHYEMN